MRMVFGIACGITVSILAYTIWQPTIAWTLTRIPPATHPDCKPRYRTWRNGVMTEGPW